MSALPSPADYEPGADGLVDMERELRAGGSLGWFVAGTGAGVAAAGLAYISQALFREVGERPGQIARVFVVAIAIVGLIDFAIGASEAVKAFTVPGS